MASANVQTVVNTLKEDPQLLLELNRTFSKIFAASQVQLSAQEKSELLILLAKGMKSPSPLIHVTM